MELSMTVRSVRPAVGLLVLLAAGTAAVAAAAVELRPHRALSDFSGELYPDDGSGDITLRGEWTYELVDTCEGWTMSSDLRMDMANPGGGSVPEIASSVSLSSYETKSGDRFRFKKMSSIKMGDHVDKEEYVGHAEPGRAVFTAPEGESMPLPEGTVFPARHLFLLIEAAIAGKSRLTRMVFDVGGLEEVTAFIGAEIPAGTPLAAHGGESAALRELAELRSWPVWISYSPFESNTPEPDIEETFVTSRLFENGVEASIIIYDGDWTFKEESLTEIEFFPPPAC